MRGVVLAVPPSISYIKMSFKRSGECTWKITVPCSGGISGAGAGSSSRLD